MKTNLFFGGIPTQADVNKLTEHFPLEQMTTGARFSYADVSALLGTGVRSHRFNTVTTMWRRRVEIAYNIIIGCDIERESFYVLSEPEKVKLSLQKLRSSVSFSRRSIVVSGRVDLKQLTDEDRKSHDFNCIRAAAIITTGQLRKKDKQLPEMEVRLP
jgi:hypothetical protein